ncbi:DNA N-6-adenine-methyltransferase [Brevundimonas bacteroides]|uniref:DNA N-6-adenine-methyltransferase n=1 Tax=Brevundimonas bacteroides TaxID=74311 RepID=UPI00055874BC|nr:DNA N-6-adenine-methyltransferase [Brevundimonas bacteroides]
MSASHRFDNAKRRRSDDHPRQALATPAYVLEPVRRLLGGIGLDPCTDPDNPTGADRFYCLPQDGASLPWDAPSIFVNPPYGEARKRWVERCVEAGTRTRVVLLIPAHTESKVFQLALRSCDSVLFIDARLRFGVMRDNGRQEAASHGSALLSWNVDLSRIVEDVCGVVMQRQAASPFRKVRPLTPTLGVSA